jgi:hypothetical protein
MSRSSFALRETRQRDREMSVVLDLPVRRAVRVMPMALLAVLAPATAHADATPAAVTPATATTGAAAAPEATPPPSARQPTKTPAKRPQKGHWVYIWDPTDGPEGPPPPSQNGPVYATANTWDLNIDGAAGRFLGDDAKWTGFVRARAGALLVREPLYWSIGATYEYSSLANATFGIQAEVLHLDSGLWAQIGVLLDTNAHQGVMAAVGYSLIGAEVQYRTYDGLGSGIAAYVKLRAPIGVIAYVFGRRDKKEPQTVKKPTATTSAPEAPTSAAPPAASSPPAPVTATPVAASPAPYASRRVRTCRLRRRCRAPGTAGRSRPWSCSRTSAPSRAEPHPRRQRRRRR